MSHHHHGSHEASISSADAISDEQLMNYLQMTLTAKGDTWVLFEQFVVHDALTFFLAVLLIIAISFLTEGISHLKRLGTMKSL